MICTGAVTGVVELLGRVLTLGRLMQAGASAAAQPYSCPGQMPLLSELQHEEVQ